MRKRWRIIHWNGEQLMYEDFPEFKISPWSWVDDMRYPGAIKLLRHGKPTRICLTGDVIIIDMNTSEYASDLEYLPIYEP